MRGCLVALLALLSITSAAFTTNCGGYYTNGTYVSLAALAGNYYFNNVGPVEGTPPEYLPQPVVSFELGICQPVTTTNSACATSSAAANVIMNGVCMSAGDSGVAAWNPARDADGVTLTYYHGANITRTNDLATIIRFVCGPEGNVTYQFFANVTYVYVFSVSTPLACAYNAIAPPTPADPSISCQTSFRQANLDLSPTKSATGGFLFTNITGDNSTVFEVQVCGNVKTRYPQLCTTPSPANVVNTVTGTCTPAGNISTYAWNINPESDAGVGLILYHGADVFPAIGSLSTRIYFECTYIPFFSPTPLPTNTLVYVHYAPHSGNGGQHHLVMVTDAACPPSFIPTPTPAPPAPTPNPTPAPSKTTTTTSSSCSVALSMFVFAAAIVASF